MYFDEIWSMQRHKVMELGLKKEAIFIRTVYECPLDDYELMNTEKIAAMTKKLAKWFLTIFFQRSVIFM